VEQHQPCKLAVILHADVAGSTALVRRNERLAHERIQSAFRILSESVRSYGGFAREIRGDALVAEFARASDAVCAALHFQGSNYDINKRLNDDVVPVVRIGIALGEGIYADGAVTGPGVVLAQRVEQLAAPGGVCVTAAIHEALPKRLPFEQENLGEKALKGFDEPLRVYKVTLTPGEAVPGAETTKQSQSLARSRIQFFALVSLVLILIGGASLWLKPWESEQESAASMGVDSVEQQARKPSIVVLPFEELSKDASQEPFADGITEDIITDLSGLSRLMVIASNTSFAFKGKTVNAQTIGKELGVDYVLEGSIRRYGDSVRVNAQLVDARTGFQKWAKRYDREVTEVFAVQDELTEGIVEALAIQLTSREQERLARRTTDSLAAYDHFQEGQRLAKISSEQTNLQAQAAYRRAIEADPEYGRAYGALAYVLAFYNRRGWSDSPVQTLDMALDLAKKAVSLNSAVPQTHWSLGYVHLMRKEFDLAEAAVEDAIKVAPNYADAYGLLALIKNSLGDGESAAALIEKGMKLNPYYTWDYPYNLGRAFYTQGRLAEAIEALEEAKQRNENVVPIRLHLAASYVRAGRLDDAEWEVEEIQILNPADTLSHLRATFPMRDPQLLNNLLDDLRAAGLPEE